MGPLKAGKPFIRIKQPPGTPLQFWRSSVILLVILLVTNYICGCVCNFVRDFTCNVSGVILISHVILHAIQFGVSRRKFCDLRHFYGPVVFAGASLSRGHLSYGNWSVITEAIART